MRKLENVADRMLTEIRRRCDEGVPPTVRELCTALEIRSTSTAHKYLAELEDRGLIVRDKGTNRNIRMSDDTMKKIPLVGTVAAGLPILATERIETYIPYRHKGSGTFFALRVKGDSMINAGILPGDIVVVRQENVAEDGEIVVAMIDGEATVKRFYHQDNYFVLKPENPNYQFIYTKELTILGKVVSLIRDFG